MDILVYILIGCFVLMIIIGLSIANFSYDEFISVYDHYLSENYGYITVEQFIGLIAQYELNKTVNIALQKDKYKYYYNSFYNIVGIPHYAAGGTSTAELTAVAHELGHALQHKNNKAKMNNYFRKLATSKLFSKLTFPIFICGAILFFIQSINIIYAIALIALSIILLFLSISIKLSTVKIESEASNNAIYFLQKYAEFDNERIENSKQFLKSAKRTYIGDLFRTLLKWTMLVR